MTFAEKLYSLRTQYGYSQETLAEKLNVSRQAISKWELGTTLPETDKMIAISDFFDVSIDYLLELSDIPYSLSKKSREHYEASTIKFKAEDRKAIQRTVDLLEEILKINASKK